MKRMINSSMLKLSHILALKMWIPQFLETSKKTFHQTKGESRLPLRCNRLLWARNSQILLESILQLNLFSVKRTTKKILKKARNLLSKRRGRKDGNQRKQSPHNAMILSLTVKRRNRKKRPVMSNQILESNLKLSILQWKIEGTRN